MYRLRGSNSAGRISAWHRVLERLLIDDFHVVYGLHSRAWTVLRDLGLTSNQVWGLTKTDQEWAEKLERALTAARRNELKHGTNAAYVHGCVCHECREHQRVRMARNRG